MGSKRIYEMVDARYACVQVTCDITRETHEFVVSVDAHERWTNGELIQKAFPDLSTDEREMLMTGTTPREWENLFGKDDDDG
jgi:hypothetical protein